ncbi:hypothetical protein LDENG_00123730, partial [Lucifuga dentata]
LACFWRVPNVHCIHCQIVQYFKVFVKGSYRPFCMFEPNIFNFYTCNIIDNHLPKHTAETVNFFFPTFQTAIGFSSFWYAIKINLLILEMFLG